MSIAVYINFNGNCREAVEFYSEAFETPIQQIMTFGDAPQNPNHPLPESAKNFIMHTFLMINGNRVMFSDVFPGHPFQAGNNISLTVLSKDMDALKRYFSKLKEDGTVGMELQETFWSKCYGMVTDQFGVNWQLSYENE